MNMNENKESDGKSRVAQPADEEIKLHGDQLAKEVKTASGIKQDENSQNKEIKGGSSNNS